MSSIRWTLLIIAWFLFISSASAQEIGAPDALFQSTEVIDVRIEAPISTLLSERPDDEELPGKFQYTNSAGEAVEFDIKLRTRGRFRRSKDHCQFPPLRLNFNKAQTDGTLFHKQDKVKLVTHCQNSSKYVDVLMREYTAYRILNVITDASFRVRMLRITYVDDEGKKRDSVDYGFIIEHRDRLAKRLDRPVLDVERISPRSLDPELASIISMYHYLIGNTDFSAVRGAKGETCCHNHVLFAAEDKAVWSVPYDFDQAGLVDAPYAWPAPRFKLRNVKQRLYRGHCNHIENIKATITNYQNKQEEVLQVLSELEVTRPRTVRSMTHYINNFYATLASERRVNSEFVKGCI